MPLDPPGAPPWTVALYWLPLGAGGHSVRFNGRVYEAAAARLAHRPANDLYHSALEVQVDGARHVIEMAPSWDADGAARGAVFEGPVGARWAGRWRLFRYEVRCWRDGTIPDIDEAVKSPQGVSRDPVAATRVLSLVAAAPRLVWGRDDLGTGDMWNSNSLVAWLLVRSGIGISAVRLPDNGRAPGWDAGLAASGTLPAPVRGPSDTAAAPAA